MLGPIPDHRSILDGEKGNPRRTQSIAGKFVQNQLGDLKERRDRDIDIDRIGDLRTQAVGKIVPLHQRIVIVEENRLPLADQTVAFALDPKGMAHLKEDVSEV